MLLKNFNKLGDTTFRVKSQILGYSSLLNFLIENTSSIDLANNKSEFNELICNWAREEGLYEYNKTPNKKEIQRYDLIFKLLDKQAKLTYKVDFKYYLKDEILSEIQKSKYIEEVFFKHLYINYLPFQQTIDFIFKNPNKILDVDILSLSFIVTDFKNENISNVYGKISELGFEESIFNIAKDIYKENIVNSLEPIQSFSKLFRKKSKDWVNLTNLLEEKLKFNNEPISPNNELITVQFSKNGILHSTRKRLKLKSLTDLINKFDFHRLILELIKTKTFNLLKKEYGDLFKRWLNDFRLISGKHIDKSVLEKNDMGIAWVNKLNHKTIDYPYSYKEVILYLSNIQNRSFEFKKTRKELEQVLNSAIAEYFVNLYYAYNLNINPKEFSNFSRTKLQPNTLFPSTPAPGKGADMYFKEKDTLYIIETTIHDNESSIKKHEIFPIENHTNINKIATLNESEKLQIKKEIVKLVCPVDQKETLDEIQRKLDLVLQNLKNETHVQDIDCKVLNFKQLN